MRDEPENAGFDCGRWLWPDHETGAAIGVMHWFVNTKGETE